MQEQGGRGVLTVNRVGFLGGVERVIISCGLAARSIGLRSLIASPPGELSEEARRRGLEVVRVAINRSRSSLSPIEWIRALTAFRRGAKEIESVARSNGIRIIHAHHPIGAFYSVGAAKQLRIPLILHVHETLPVHKLYATVTRFVIPYCAAFVCVSEESRKMIVSLGAAEDRVQVVYNGVDPLFMQDPKSVKELGPGPHIGLFGVLEPRKGQDLFVKAAKTVARACPTAQFWIIGDLSYSENAKYVASLRSEIVASGLSDKIALVGFRQDVKDWMAQMNTIVLASRDRESLPTVLIEGAMLGRPLVATNVGGVSEIIRNEVSGLIVQPSDPSALAAAIIRCIGPEGSAFGAAARQDAFNRFTFERFQDKMSSLYRRLAD